MTSGADFPSFPKPPWEEAVAWDQEAIRELDEDTKARIADGETLWSERNSESERGRTVDLYAEGQHKGYVKQSYDDMKCMVYIRLSDAEDDSVCLTTQPVDIKEAEKTLKEAAHLR